MSKSKTLQQRILELDLVERTDKKAVLFNIMIDLIEKTQTPRQSLTHHSDRELQYCSDISQTALFRKVIDFCITG